ncbi:MAG: tRNA lysidine(34) synthetase TilS [Candidatus Karelsulcia muelleri]
MFYKKLKNKKISVAVSSGLDSMVMLDLLLKSCCPIGVIHCNFNLRGDDSDKDEFFIQEFCLKNNLNFKYKNFNTSIRSKLKFSIQMIARKLRYDWFKFLLNKNNSDCDYIALGHHLDDSIETFFINIIRGTGIKGLIGINNFKKNKKLFLLILLEELGLKD